jgi:hypothetical protein
MNRPLKAVVGLVAVSLFAIALESEARACGGCFAPPGAETVVTDHRMILSVSKGHTTLYDQIRYQGSPESFAWVLPIVGTVQVGLSSDLLFTGIDNQTTTAVSAPPSNCPTPPQECFSEERASAPNDGAGSSSGGVSVLERAVVGPFETVQLRSTDADALNKWLATNNFSVPDAVKPVIAQYVAEKFDFLALKLVPGKGVNDMRPVRVTTQGASAVLPLRMVAAGTGATVGITLWTFAEGRYEPQNFPTYRIQDSELVWDWTASRSNFTELRKAKGDASGGKAWELESSLPLSKQQVQFGLNARNGPTTAAGDYLGYSPAKDAQGTILKTAEEVSAEDLDVLFSGIPGTARVTRIRADLNQAALAADLLLTASADQGQLTRDRVAQKELNQPQCPVYDGCAYIGNAPRDEAIAQTNANNGLVAGGKSLCTVSNTPISSALSPVSLVALSAFLGLVVSRRRKRS